MKCDLCDEMAITSVLKDLFGKSGAVRNLCSIHAPPWSMVGAPQKGFARIRELEAALAEARSDLEREHKLHVRYAGVTEMQAERIRRLEAAIREEHGGKHHEPECPLCAVLTSQDREGEPHGEG